MSTTFGIKIQGIDEIEIAHRHSVGNGKCEYKFIHPKANELCDHELLTPLDNGGEDLTVGEIRAMILKQNSPSTIL